MTLRSTSVLVVISLAVLTGAARAQGTCNSPRATQFDLNACAAASLKRADTELNALYQRIRLRLKDDAETAKDLAAAQRAWLAFRDAECEFSSGSEAGGSIYPMVYSNCVEALTRKRIGDFKAYLKCGDGDMECPVPAS